MRTGDRVRVSARGIEPVAADVVDLRTVDELPDLPGFETPAHRRVPLGMLAAEARAALHEWRVIRLAWLAYDHRDRKVIFVALETPVGWCDLQGQCLDIVGAPPLRKPPGRERQAVLFDTAPRPG